MKLFNVGALWFVVATSLALEMPPYIKPCPKDENFNKCAAEHGQEAIPFIAEGDEKYNIPNMKPLKIPQVNIPNKVVTVTLNDVEVYGLDKSQIKNMALDHENYKASVTLHIDNVNVQGKYVIDGYIMLLPISGNGGANITFENGDYTYQFDWTLEKRDDAEEYAKIKDYKVDYELGGAHFKFDNLFNGNAFLGNRMNDFINANWKYVTSIFEPTSKEMIGKICHDIITNFFEKIPYKQFFP